MKGVLNNLILFPAFSVVIIFLFIVLPFPLIVIDIFIGINFFFSILIFCIIMRTKKIIEITFFPTIFLLLAVFNFAITVCVVKPILAKGANFDGWIISIISNFITGSGNAIYFYFGFSLFLVFIAITLIGVYKSMSRVSEMAVKQTDSMQVRMTTIETELNCRAITEEQAQTRKADIQVESDFVGALDGVSKFISGNVKIIIFIILVIIIGGSTIDYLFRDVALVDAVKTYIRLSIGSGIVFLVPVILQSLAVWIMTTKFANTEVYKNEI